MQEQTSGILVEPADLTVDQKVAWFDWLASRTTEAKIALAFGGSEWIYPGGDARRLVTALETLKSFEDYSGDEE